MAKQPQFLNTTLLNEVRRLEFIVEDEARGKAMGRRERGLVESTYNIGESGNHRGNGIAKVVSQQRTTCK